MSNAYSSPEKFGLRVVGAVERPDLSWEFDMIVVWQDIETLRLYYAQDSGCSCPSPFEDHGRDDLAPITRQTVGHFHDAVVRLAGYAGSSVLREEGCRLLNENSQR